MIWNSWILLSLQPSAVLHENFREHPTVGFANSKCNKLSNYDVNLDDAIVIFVYDQISGG